MEKLETNQNAVIKVNYNTNFLLLFMGRLVSNLGSAVFNFALGLYVMDITGSATAFTMIISFAIIPGILVNIVAGVFVDRNDRKKIIVASDILSGLAVFLFMLIFKANSTSMWVFILYVIVLNTIQAFFGLAINASVPDIVSKERVAKANSLFQTIGPVIGIIGPILGAILYKSVGLEMVFIINAASFILSGISETFIVFIYNKDKHEKAERKSFFEDVKAVFNYLNEQKMIKFLLVMGVILNAILNPMVALVIQFITYKKIGISSFQLSLINATWAMGPIIGAIFVMTRKSVHPLLKRFFVFIGIQAVLIILWSFPKLAFFASSTKSTITMLYMLTIFLYGLINTIQNIPIFTHFQLKVPENLRGRVFGVMFTALNISTPIGMWIFGIALEKVDWVYIPIVSGVVILLICITQSRNVHFKQFTDSLKE